MAASQPKKLQSSEGPNSLFGYWFMAVIWCGLSGGATYGILYDVGQGAPLWVKGMVVLFDVIGACLLYAALKETLGYLKFGKVYLTLTGDPPAAGRSLSAVLDLPEKAAGATLVKAELACISLSWSRDSDNRRSRSESDFWSVKRDFPVRRGVQGGSAVLRIDIPAHLPPSDEPGEEGRDSGVSTDYNYHRWELRVKAEIPGLDFERKFSLQVLPGLVVAGAPRALPAATMPVGAPVLAPGIEKRIEARSASERKLSALCAFVGIAPFVVPFAIGGLAVGLAGCPMGWSHSQPPSCAFAGIDWGPIMAGAFDLMFYAIPAGIAGSALLYFLGQLWLARRFQTSSFGGQGGLAIALVAVGFVIYQAWQFARPIRTDAAIPSQVTQPSAAREDASNDGRGYPAQYVKVTGKDFKAETHGADLLVRVGEIRLESTGKLADAPYFSLGINIYQKRRDLGSAYDGEVRGKLTAAAPSTVLNDLVFIVPGAGAACLQGGCEARLLLAIRTGANSSHGENTDFAALTVRAGQEIALPPSGPPKYWDTHFNRALTAFGQQRYAEAERLLMETSEFIEGKLGADHPAAARVQYQLSLVYERQKTAARQEQALLRALEILEKHADAAVKKELAPEGGWLDKEMVARRLGDFYWDQRRYDQSYLYFDRAYRYVPEIQTSDYSRNLRLARNSAGRMAGACTQGNWDVADSAMKELKERIVKVDAETRKQLDYWIRTGEPRLAARKC